MLYLPNSHVTDQLDKNLLKNWAIQWKILIKLIWIDQLIKFSEELESESQENKTGICFLDQNINKSIAGQWTKPNKIVAQKVKNIYREIRIKFDLPVKRFIAYCSVVS